MMDRRYTGWRSGASPLRVRWMLAGVVGAVGVETLLNSLPDVVAGLVCGLEQEAGLIGDVLQVPHQGRTVVAGLQMRDQAGILGNAAATRGEEIGKLLLKFGAGDGGRRFRIGILRSHWAASLRPACGVHGWRSNSRSLSRALCS